MQDWLVDTPPDVYVMNKLSWIRLGSRPLKPTAVKLRGGSGADFARTWKMAGARYARETTQGA